MPKLNVFLTSVFNAEDVKINYYSKLKIYITFLLLKILILKNQYTPCFFKLNIYWHLFNVFKNDFNSIYKRDLLLLSFWYIEIIWYHYGVSYYLQCTVCHSTSILSLLSSIFLIVLLL